jgi:chromosome segregation ATPase
MADPADFLQEWHNSTSQCHNALRSAIRADEPKDKITESRAAVRAILTLLDKLKEYLKSEVRRSSDEIERVQAEVDQIIGGNKEISRLVLQMDVLLARLDEQENQLRNHPTSHKTIRQMESEADRLVERIMIIDDKLDELLDNIEDLVYQLRQGGHRSAATVRRIEVHANIERFRPQFDETTAPVSLQYGISAGDQQCS